MVMNAMFWLFDRSDVQINGMEKEWVDSVMDVSS